MPRDAGRGTTMGHGNPAKLSELSVGRVVVHSRGPRTTGGGIVKVPPQQPKRVPPTLNLEIAEVSLKSPIWQLVFK